MKEKIEFLANIKSVTSRTLISGDKQTEIKLIVVGQDTGEANKLSDLEPVSQVKVEYDPELSN